MGIMIFSFVVFRQIYLFVLSHITINIRLIAFGYPAGWLVCSLLMAIYFAKSHWEKRVPQKQ